MELDPKIRPRILGSQPKIMLIAPKPTLNELKSNHAFGSSELGQLENSFIQVGVTSLYMTYLCKEYFSEEKRFYKETKKEGVWTSENFLQYQEDLLKEISTVQPTVIMTIGESPLYALTGRTNIAKRRGSPYILEGSDIVIIPTITPSVQVPKYLDRYIILNDVRKVEGFMRGTRTIPERKIKIITDIHDARLYLKEYSKLPIMGFDIETSIATKGFLSIAFAKTPTESFVIPLVWDKGNFWTLQEEMEIIRLIGDIIENPEIKKVGQNTFFDAYYLAFKHHMLGRNFEDTLVMQGTLYHEFPKGLDYLASAYTNEPYYKDDGKEAFKSQRSDEKFWRYNAKDAMVTLEVYYELHRQLTALGNINTYLAQMELFEPMLYASLRGFRLNHDGMEELSYEYGKRLDETQRKVNTQVGRPLNPNSPKQLKEYFYGELGYKPYVFKGKVTTDVNAMIRLSRKPNEVAKLILEYRKYRKLKSTYLDMSLDPDNRLRTFWKLAGTSFGRMASSKTTFETGANMQNQPAGMKKYMLPDEGYILYSIDLEQAENRIVAYLANDQYMIKAFENGIDIHSLTASLIFMTPIEKIIADNHSKVHVDIGNGDGTMRFWGKKANHGLNYGLGYRSFSMYYELQERDSRTIVEKYHTAYPTIRLWHQRIKSTIFKQRYLVNPFGRKIYFLDFVSETLLKAAYSCIPQSTVPDIIRGGIVHMTKTVPEFDLKNQVHDSIVFQLPIKLGLMRHALILKSLEKKLTEPLTIENRTFSIPISIEYTKTNLGDTKEIKSQDIPDNAGALMQLLSRGLNGQNIQ